MLKRTRLLSFARSSLFTAIAGLLSADLAITLRADQPALPASKYGDLVRCTNGVVVTVSPPAARVGLEILRRGGTAVDAAVASAFALAVTWPEAGNIGGGGYMVVAPARGRAVVFDFREIAPAACTRDMFVKPEGRTAHRRVGVPGTVRGLALAHRRFGRLPWKELVAPAIRLARHGIKLDLPTVQSLNGVLNQPRTSAFAELHRVYGKPGAGRWNAGDCLKQPDLAATLEQLAESGPDAFYTGPVADQIVAEMKRGGGLITRDDLACYAARERKPIHGSYAGCEIFAPPPSSSGGTVLVETLNIFESFERAREGRWSPQALHFLIEAMRHSYHDRARFLGDPDFVTIPERLTSKEYARAVARTIDARRTTPSGRLAGDIRIGDEGAHTTHLSIVDSERNAVSLTYTLENSYGGRIVVQGAGFLLNDEMNDFGWWPGITDATGRIGTEANLVAPRKRMLSSMCPTIVLRDGKPLLITGSPGGRTIVNTVTCVLVDVLHFKMDVRAAVDAPRLHHQWFPDRVSVEATFAKKHPSVLAALREMGHRIELTPAQGDAHTIYVDPATGELIGAADKRENGCAAGY